VWSLNLRNPFAESCLVAFVSSWSFYCFDLFACRWLLYQWHDSDPLYSARTECVPLASSMWIMTYAATASLLARISYSYVIRSGEKSPESFDRPWWALFAFCTLVFLPLHIVPINLFYFPSFYFKLNLEYECVWGFSIGCLLLSVILPETQEKKDTNAKTEHLHLAIFQSWVWFTGLAYVIFMTDPGDVVSTSVHQPYGGKSAKSSAYCNEMESYLFGLGQRRRYVCDEDLTFWSIVRDRVTNQLPSPKDEWYTIKGHAKDSEFFIHFCASLAVGIAIHIILYLLASFRSRRRKTKQN